MARTRKDSIGALAFRAMQVEDLESVMAIEREAFANPWRREDFRCVLHRSDACTLCAALDGVIVGYSVAFRKGSALHLADVAVNRDFRRMGIGGRLLEKVLHAASVRRVGAVRLEVRRSNAPAIALYRSAGFSTVGVRRAYYTNPADDGFVMVKVLRGTPRDRLSGIQRTQTP